MMDALKITYASYVSSLIFVDVSWFASAQMTHTDLKPENILLAANAPPQRTSFPREDAWKAGESLKQSKTDCENWLTKAHFKFPFQKLDLSLQVPTEAWQHGLLGEEQV